MYTDSFKLLSLADPIRAGGEVVGGRGGSDSSCPDKLAVRQVVKSV